MFDSPVAGPSIQKILLGQGRLYDVKDEKRPIAELIIGNIDDYGYLKSSVEELAFSTNIPAENIAKILRIIQTFHPPGVGARDLRECLLLQLDREGRQKTLEYRIISEHMEALGKRRVPELARAFGPTPYRIQKA